MSWRPEDWLPRVFSDAEEERVFEAGADAMLEVLKAEGKECDGISPLWYSPDGRPGWLISIPDEEVKDVRHRYSG